MFLLALFYLILIVAGLFLPISTEGKQGEQIKQISPILTHQQEVWISALEWCESRGDLKAINPKDRDGTPSYYSFQWKPSTFKMYGIRYGLLEPTISDEMVLEKMKDYKLQHKILEYMLFDSRVKWSQEFPDCVNIKIGFPPI